MSPLSYISVLLLIADLTHGQTEVETTHGPVVGTEDTYSGETVRRFRGIPFAKPPTGKRRFLPPEEPDKWTEPLDTKEYSPRCYQASRGGPNIQMNEDCLYLNVFSPKGGINLPVMVWIHGGGLLGGSASLYEAETMAISGNIVTVTINYRLDIFGFFSTGNDVVEGNAGLLDQVMALKWVKNNIENFGGDPDQVTIFGGSAGSWCVNLHMVSPMSKGLFQRAISQSGTLYGYRSPGKSISHSKTKILATSLNCSNIFDSQEILSCLQMFPAAAILGAAYAVRYTAPGTMVSVGDSFLPMDPQTLYDNGDINPADYILGANSEEGTVGLLLMNRTSVNHYLDVGISTGNPDFLSLAMRGLSAVDNTASMTPNDPVWRMLSNQYLTNFENYIQNMRGVLDMIADAIIIGPTINCAHAMARNSDQKVYLYYFDQVMNKTRSLPGGLDQNMFAGSEEMKMGAAHASEIPYVFGFLSENATDLPSNLYSFVSEADRAVGKSMMNAWITFATTGTPKVLIDGTKETEWPEYSPTTQEYVEFKNPMSEGSIKKRLLPNRVGIFTDILPKFLKNTEINEKNKKEGNELKETICHDTPSTIDRDKAETALFILIAVVIVLLLVTLILIMNYCSMKKELKKKEGDELYKINT